MIYILSSNPINLNLKKIGHLTIHASPLSKILCFAKYLSFFLVTSNLFYNLFIHIIYFIIITLRYFVRKSGRYIPKKTKKKRLHF